MRMRVEIEARGIGGTFDHSGKARRRERGSPLSDEDEGRRIALAIEPAQGPEFVANQRMGERDIHVRIAGGFGRAIGLRDREILTVRQNPCAT